MPTRHALESVLLCGPPPTFTRDRVVLSPSHAVTIDGDRVVAPIHVTTTCGRTVTRSTEPTGAKARRLATREIDRVDPSIVVIERPAAIRQSGVGRRAGRLVEDLQVVADRVGARLVGWQHEPASPRDRRHFQVVVETATRGGERELRRATRPRRRSDSHDTGP